MKRKLACSPIFTAGIFLIGILIFAYLITSTNISSVEAAPRKITQGALQILDKHGQPGSECSLKHTGVKVEITGHLARVNVTQLFHNTQTEKIEAVYVFPLPQNAAVDDMTMTVGDRIVKGKIKSRAEARATYETARQQGHVAALLDQERPNIFTQSVTNILPGAEVKISISYVEFLTYEDGTYEFVFPMVVGPRYIPGLPTGKQGGGWALETTQVPDASRITPQVTPPGTRAGHDIAISVSLDAGVPIDSLKSTLHDVDIERPNEHRAEVRLKHQLQIPNKDFILKFDVAGKKVEDAIITHRSDQGGYFTLILQPPERVVVSDVTPKELVFVLDTSGSMQGFPIEKAKEAMKLGLDGLYPEDTFNLITFSGDTHILFPQPVPATRENLHKAQVFLASRTGSGGTEMMKAIRVALDPSDQQEHLRIVCFMTDGYVGNDFEIIGEIQKHPNARVFSFGIGQSVNRFLPLLTDVSIDWGGLPVADIYPQRLPDLFSAKPVVLTGRYTAGGRGVVRLRGKMAGQEIVREIPVEFPESQPQHDVLKTLWARARIDDLMSQGGTMKPELTEAITQLGLEYRLMTQFTSFVAVEEMVVTDGGQPRRVDVPVEIPEGVSYEGVFGTKNESDEAIKMETDLVLLDVSVVDQNNTPILDLKKDDFAVFEDRVKQDIQSFTREEVPISFGLVIDTSGSMRSKIQTVTDSSKELIRQMRKGDEAFIAQFKSEPELVQDFSTDRRELEDALGELFTSGGTALLDAIIATADYAQEKANTKDGQRRRRALIVVSDGLEKNSAVKEKEVLDVIKEDEVQIYLIGFIDDDEEGKSFFGKSPAKKAKGLLQRLADDSGGRAFFPKDVSEMQGIVAQISKDLRQQYVISYYPSNDKRDGTYRTVKVSINSQGNRKMIARTRNGYYSRNEKGQVPTPSTRERGVNRRRLRN